MLNNNTTVIDARTVGIKARVGRDSIMFIRERDKPKRNESKYDITYDESEARVFRDETRLRAAAQSIVRKDNRYRGHIFPYYPDEKRTGFLPIA